MRTLLSIPLAILILFSGLTVNIATHYCGGSAVATKVSLSGELATCGMEQGTPENSSRESIKSHCCDNSISSFSFNSKFVPSYYLLSFPCHQIVDVPDLASDYSILNDNLKLIAEEIIRPPGVNSSSQACQEILCIFRI
jgi:hypothetical protein